MDTQVVKRTSAPLKYEKAPEEFLRAILQYLETLQTVYRTKLPDAELLLWRETLKDYSFQEFDQAMRHLIKNPPKYEVGGEIQVWRGMPKLPDVVQVMLDQREKNLAEYMQQERQKAAQEAAEYMEQVKQHPEDYFNVNEAIQEFMREYEARPKKQPERIHTLRSFAGLLKDAQAENTMSDSQIAERKRQLREQMLNINPNAEKELEELKQRRPELFKPIPEPKEPT